MKLSHYQIEHIREYIDAQNIWYDDIKIELLDHIVCNIEHQMEASDIKFIEAAARAIEEVNPSAIQKERLKVEHIATFKEVYHEAIGLFSGSKIYLAVMAVLMVMETVLMGMVLIPAAILIVREDGIEFGF